MMNNFPSQSLNLLHMMGNEKSRTLVHVHVVHCNSNKYTLMFSLQMNIPISIYSVRSLNHLI